MCSVGWLIGKLNGIRFLKDSSDLGWVPLVFNKRMRKSLKACLERSICEEAEVTGMKRHR